VKSIRILLIDDSPDDRALAARELRLRFPGCFLQAVGTEAELDQGLQAEGCDLVITDYHLPWTDGLEIMHRVRERFPGVPVIIYTGTGNEKIAARALKEGADDYVIKTAGRVPQLIMASQLALDRSAERQAALQARARFQEFSETLPIGWIQLVERGIIINANLQMAQMLGFPDRETLLACATFNFFEDDQAQKEFHRRVRMEKILDGYEIHLRRKDGTLLWARFFAHPITTLDGQSAYEAVVEDIQARKDAEQIRIEKEQELQRINESLRVILEAAPTAIVGINTDAIIDFVWNRAAEQLLGKTREEAIGQSVFSVIPEMLPRSPRIRAALFQPTAIQGSAVTYHRPDGQAVNLLLHASTVTNTEGKPIGMIAILLDVTERKRAEDRLRLSESRLSLIYESVSDFLVLLSLETEGIRIVMVNRAVTIVTGIPADGISGGAIDEVFSGAFSTRVEAHCREVMQSRQPCTFITSTRLLNGRRLTTENTLTPILDSDGGCTRVLLVARDIETRLKSEMGVQQALYALRESEHRYRTLAEAAHDMIYILDREMRITFVNSFAARNLRHSPEQLLGRNMMDLFPPEIAVRQEGSIHQVLETGEPIYREAPSYIMGQPAWLGSWLVPMRNSQGVIEEVLGLSRDITERVAAEQRLRQSEEQYRSLVQTSPDAIFLHDLDGTITFANRQAAEILGYENVEELNGRVLPDLIPPDERPAAEAHLRTLLESGSLRNIVHTFQRRDGTTVPMEMNATLIRDPQGRTKAMVAVLRDITERRRREKALQESEARFRVIFEKAAIGAVLLDRDQNITGCNAALCEILGYSHEQLLARSLPALTHADDLAIDQPFFEQILKNQIDHYRQEKRLRRMDGSTAWCRLTISAVRGENDQLLFLVGMIEDISKQREAEQAQQQAGEALRRYTDRLETLHDIDQAILQAESTEEIARGTLEHMSRLLPCQRSSLILFDFDTKMLTIINARAQMESSIDKGTRIPFAQLGYDLDALSRGELFAMEDLVARSSLSPIEQRLLGEGIRSILAIPLLDQGRLVGALNIASEVPGAFTREHAEIVQEVAGMLAVALQQARLLEQVRRHTFELESIAALNQDLRVAPSRKEIVAVLLRRISTMLRCEFAGLLATDPSTGELFFEKVTDAYAFLEGSRVSPADGITGQTIEEMAPFRNNKPEEIQKSPYLEVIHSMQAIACVPMITRGQTIGALWVGRKRTENPSAGEISDADLRLLVSIGDVAANAIQRATLHDQTEQRLTRLAALRAVDMAISASIDLRVSLSVLLDQVTTQLHMDAGDVLMLDPRTQSLAYVAGRGFHAPERSRISLPLGQGFAGIAALERRVVSIPRLAEAQEKFAVALRTGAEHFASYFAAPLVAKGQVRGVLEVYSRSVLEPDSEWLEFLETTAAQAAIAIDNSTMFEDLQRTNTDLIMAYDATIEGWSRTLELRDRDTSGHTGRVTELTVQLARRMGIRESELIHVRRGALMHDIGKISIPDSILHKPGPLTPEEWEIMRKHPVTAYELLYPIVYLRAALDIPYGHHEKWDGSGYPRGLAQDQIPLAARVFAIIDVWDALRSDRPYRKAWPEAKVHEHLRAGSGNHFDPVILDAFFEMSEISLP
jgi:PAS domain S-box-containing protein